MADLLGISAAAKALGKDKSVISRWVRQHPELNHAPDGYPPAVDVEELRAHRDGTLQTTKAGNHAGLFVDEVEADSGGHGDGQTGADTPATTSDGGQGDTASLTVATEKARHERAKRIKAERANDEDAGRLIPRAEADEAIADTLAPVREALEGLGGEVAPEVADLTDHREIQRVIDERVRQSLEGVADGLHDAIARVAGDDTDAPADAA